MQERALGVRDEGVRDPEQRHQAPVHAHTLISREHQPGITPPLTEEDSCGVVLKRWCCNSFISLITLTIIFTRWSGKGAIPCWFRRWRQCWRCRDSFQFQQDPLSQREIWKLVSFHDVSAQIATVVQLLLFHIKHDNELEHYLTLAYVSQCPRVNLRLPYRMMLHDQTEVSARTRLNANISCRLTEAKRLWTLKTILGNFSLSIVFSGAD